MQFLRHCPIILCHLRISIFGQRLALYRRIASYIRLRRHEILVGQRYSGIDPIQ